MTDTEVKVEFVGKAAEAMVSGATVTLPTDCVVNAGVYTFCFSIPDDSISMREMK